jgi:hypothetical protein
MLLEITISFRAAQIVVAWSSGFMLMKLGMNVGQARKKFKVEVRTLATNK